jgi:hypothetical protein
MGKGLVEGPTRWREQQQSRIGFFSRHCVQCQPPRLGTHHHARPSPVRCVVDRPMSIKGPIAKIVKAKIDEPVLDRLAHQ